MAIHLTRIYTRTGDGGQTRLGDFSQVPKSGPRVGAYADVDEANAAIGVALALSGAELTVDIRELLERTQHDLFDVGADLCTPVRPDPEFPPLRVEQAYIDRLEASCDIFNEKLTPLTSFILPGGTAAAALLHVARTTVRRAERSAWALVGAEPATTSPLPAVYLNRLADLLFILGRVVNPDGDVMWKPGQVETKRKVRTSVFDLTSLLEQRAGENYELHSQLLNPQLPRVLKTLGFDRVYVRGEGCYLYDDTGRRYLDMLSGFGVYALGRSHPVIKQALHDAIDADLANMVQFDCGLLPGLLAEQLVARSHGGIERVFFCNSGAEAVESAIKFARKATGRSRLVFCDHAFHGLTTGALSLNGGKEFRKGFGPLLASDKVPWGDIGALEKRLKRRDVAAFVAEPIQGKVVELAPAGYWAEVSALCKKYGTLFVLDEVQTGMGRTGKFFAHEHWGVEPDIITMSKALSGGYVPVGAMLCSERVYRSVYSSMDRALVHSSTFGRNQLAMVAGLATLAVFDDEDIVANAARTGTLFLEALAPLVDRYEMLHAVRGQGLMISLVFGEPTSRGLRMRYRAVELMRTALFAQLMVVPLFHRHGVLTQVAADGVNVIKLLPSLIAGEQEVKLMVDALDDVLHDAHEGGLFLEVGRTVAGNVLSR